MWKCRDEPLACVRSKNKERRANGCRSQLPNKTLLICLSRQVCGVCVCERGWKNIKSNFRARMKAVFWETVQLFQRTWWCLTLFLHQTPRAICSAKHRYNQTKRCALVIWVYKRQQEKFKAQCFMLGISIMYRSMESLFPLWAQDEGYTVNILEVSSAASRIDFNNGEMKLRSYFFNRNQLV